MESSNYMMLRKIGGPLVEFIRFLPRVLLYGVPNHQYKCYGVVLNDFQVDYLGITVLWIGCKKNKGECWVFKGIAVKIFVKPLFLF